MNRIWLNNYDDGVQSSLEYPGITLPQLLVDTAADYPDYISTTFNGNDITYREMDEKVNAFARALLDMDVKRGDRVALILPNSPTYVIATYAVMKLAAIVVNINVMTHGEELASFVNDSGSRVVVTLDIFLQNVVDIVGDTCLEEIVIHSVFDMEKKIDISKGSPEINIFNDLVSAFSVDGLPLMCRVDDVAVLQYPDVTEYLLSAIEIASAGGAPVPLWVQDKYKKLTGRKLSVAYGLSEASSSTHIAPFKTGAPPGSIGVPLPDTDARIVDLETGKQACLNGEIGELIIKGPQIMQGHWNNKALTELALRDGWLYTGDLGYMDENGYFYIVDRKDDLIISSGFNVYPSDIENALVKHEGVKDAGVIGAPDPIRGESIVAFVVMEEGVPFDLEELFKHCREHLPEFKVPRRIRPRGEIPYNRVGKPLRKVLREEL